MDFSERVFPFLREASNFCSLHECVCKSVFGVNCLPLRRFSIEATG